MQVSQLIIAFFIAMIKFILLTALVAAALAKGHEKCKGLPDAQSLYIREYIHDDRYPYKIPVYSTVTIVFSYNIHKNTTRLPLSVTVIDKDKDSFVLMTNVDACGLKQEHTPRCPVSSGTHIAQFPLTIRWKEWKEIRVRVNDQDNVPVACASILIDVTGHYPNGDITTTKAPKPTKQRPWRPWLPGR